MKEKLNIDKTWTLFLDRDGVINEKRENDYVKNWREFSFIDGALDAISILSSMFGKIIVVTNQRGVGKGIMTELQLLSIHDNLIKLVNESAGRIDKIYYCTDISETSENRKPNIGMALKAKLDYSDIEFRKSIIVGDSLSDMIFGEKLGMQRVLISSGSNLSYRADDFNFTFPSLCKFSNYLLELEKYK
jgi:D-glycero-D-manno-heptose 1,7-bisphosphate phosphatase